MFYYNTIKSKCGDDKIWKQQRSAKKSSKQVSQFLVNDFAIKPTDSHVQVPNEAKQKLAYVNCHSEQQRRKNHTKNS